MGGKGRIGEGKCYSEHQFSTHLRTDDFSGVCERPLRNYILTDSAGGHSRDPRGRV